MKSSKGRRVFIALIDEFKKFIIQEYDGK
jgi:hypothetical protein